MDAREHPNGFSEQALARLLERQTEFVEEIGLESIRLAQRARNDVVSATDVDQADELIRSDARDRAQRGLEALGGLLWGGGLGTLLQTLPEENPEIWIILISTVLLVVGTALFMYGLFGGGRGGR